MADIFLSYKREDRPIAERLSISLEQLGFNVWWDFQILSGQQFRRVIEKVIDECSATVVLWSTLSRDSTFVVDEATYAREQNKLCPARIDNCRLPLGFGGDHVVDLSGWDGEMQHPGLQELLSSLEAATGKKARLGAKPRTETDEARFAEMEAFKAAQAAENVSALRAFLRDYPRGAFANFVTGQLESMQADARVASEARAELQRAPPPAPPPPVYTPPPAPAPPRYTPPPSYQTADTPKSPPWAMIGIGAAALVLVVGGFLFMQSQNSGRQQQEARLAQEEAAREREARVAAEQRAGEFEAQAATEREARERAEQSAAQFEQAERERVDREATAQRADDDAWSRARGRNTSSAYNSYLSSYPGGRHAAEARAALSRLQAGATTTATTTTPRTAAFDLSQLNAQVRAAAERARSSQRSAQSAAARARAARDLATGGSTAGYSVESYDNGDYYGQYTTDRMGVGVYVYRGATINSRYEGEWASSQHGYGIIYQRNGDRYEGRWSRARRSEAGVQFFADGQRYEGDFVDNNRHGYGVQWGSDGRVAQAGLWTDGAFTQSLR